MEITKRIDNSKISPEKLKEVKVHWSMSNQPSQKALENFNRALANAQIRIYRKSLGTQ